ncbi:MAG: hypothetical protein QM493_03265 [Sulfurovum sp.]
MLVLLVKKYYHINLWMKKKEVLKVGNNFIKIKNAYRRNRFRFKRFNFYNFIKIEKIEKIDSLVYGLYGLSDGEIGIIEGLNKALPYLP